MRAPSRNRPARPRAFDARALGGAMLAGLLLGGATVVALGAVGAWVAPGRAEAQAAASKDAPAPAAKPTAPPSVATAKPAAKPPASAGTTAKPPAAGGTAAKPAATGGTVAKPAATGGEARPPAAPETAKPGSTAPKPAPAPKTPAPKGAKVTSGGVATKGDARPVGSAIVQSSARLDEQVSYQYNALGRRDPFQSLLTGEYVGADVGGDAPPDVGGLKVVGIVWGDADQFALVEDARGDSHILRRGDKVTNGYVEALRRDAMVVNLTVDGQSQSVTVPLTRKGEKINANR